MSDLIKQSFTDNEKAEIRDLIISTLVNYDDIMRVKSGNIESGNFSTSPAQGWKMDSAGNVQATVFTDTTYGLNGVFVKTIQVTNFAAAETDVNIVANNGGLITVTANYLSGSDNFLKQLPGFNLVTNKEYFGVQKAGGFYQIYHLGANIAADIPNMHKVFYSVFFNSNETAGTW